MRKHNPAEHDSGTIRMIASMIIITFAVGVAGAWLVLTERQPATCAAMIVTDCEVNQ